MLLAVLYVLSAPVSSAVSHWADGGGQRRCFYVVLLLSAAQFSLLALSGAMLLSANRADAPSQAQAMAGSSTFVIFSALVVTSPSTAGPLWALHAWTQPAQHSALSIPFVNSVGMLGGFVGPFVFGALHDRLGPPCPPDDPKCIGAVAYGFLVVGLVCTACTATVGAIGMRLHMQGGDAQDSTKAVRAA